MKNMIYTMGYIAENGDVILKGAYRTGDTDNIIFIKVSENNISADVIKVEAGTTELPEDMVRNICDKHTCGCCPLDSFREDDEG